MPKVNGPLLRRTRRVRGETVDEVAPTFGIAPGSLRNIENMRGEASDAVIAKMALYYQLDEDKIRDVASGVLELKRQRSRRQVLKVRSVA